MKQPFLETAVTQKTWWKESVIYQIYPRSFNDSNGDGIGDLNGVTKKLDYLQNLGVDVLWLSPVYQSPNDDNGYDISDYQSIMKEFGTMEDWEQLLYETHKRGMKMIMDLVVNHSSDEHKWFKEAKKSKDNPYRDYYIWRPGKNGKEPNNWASAFSGSAWEYDQATDEYYLHLFSRKQPDLNWENSKLREEIYRMMKWWLDKGVDGFRMDVINFISKMPGLPDAPVNEAGGFVWGGDYFLNGPRIHEFLQEMNEEVLSHRDIMTVGEMPGATVEDAQLYTDFERKELNMVFTFEHMDLDAGPGGKWDLRPFELAALKQNLTKWQKGLQGRGWNSLYFNNHDQPRIVSRFGNDNAYRVESAKMLATVLHMLQGTPYIYQGEELGMTNVRFESIEEYKDIEILNMYREKVEEQNEDPEKVMESIYVKGRDNARTPMQWDDSENAGFSTGKPWIRVNPNYKDINAKQAVADPHSVYHYYKQLISLRKSHDIIVYGEYEILFEEHPHVYAFTRSYQGEQLLVVANFTEQELPFANVGEEMFEEYSLLIGNYDSCDEKHESMIMLRPYEARVYKGKARNS